MKIFFAFAAFGAVLIGACQPDDTATNPVGPEGAAILSASSEEGDLVYSSTNAAEGNRVMVFRRGSEATLSPVGAFSTIGRGAGQGLGSQGALIVSPDRQWLFVVNAGSNEVTVFRIDGAGLRLTDKVPSGGMFPVSLTFRRGILYVLNGGGPGNITGFTLDDSGDLTPLPGSTRPLSGASMTAPAQISFAPDGRLLVVTEKATNKIVTYRVGVDGLPGTPSVHDSHGQTPFGFEFSSRGILVVSEAFGGLPEKSAMSSYSQMAGELGLISGSIKDFQAAACWVAITQNQQFAFTTNTGSNSISSYGLRADGRLVLNESVAAKTGEASAPTDMAITARFLFVLNEANGEIDVFRIRRDGGLVFRSSAGGLPPLAVGLATR